MIPCIWYASETTRPWERSLIGSMASALRARGVTLSVYIDGGTGDSAHFTSWRSLSFLERFTRVVSSLSGRSLWHLWGAAPSWWSIVQLRSRTVHTLLDTPGSSLSSRPGPAWHGHPSRIFHSQAREGETVIIPTFEARIATGIGGFSGFGKVRDGEGDFDSEPAIYVNMRSASSALKETLAPLTGAMPPSHSYSQSSYSSNASSSSDAANLALLVTPSSASAYNSDGTNRSDMPELPRVPVVDTDKIYLGPTSARSGVLIANDNTSTSASEAVRAAVMTMRGLVVAGARSPYLDEILGPTGYFAVERDTPYDWRVAICEALSSAGHALAPSVRHFIKTRYSSDLCADSILELYSQVIRS